MKIYAKNRSFYYYYDYHYMMIDQVDQTEERIKIIKRKGGQEEIFL